MIQIGTAKSWEAGVASQNTRNEVACGKPSLYPLGDQTGVKGRGPTSVSYLEWNFKSSKSINKLLCTAIPAGGTCEDPYNWLRERITEDDTKPCFPYPGIAEEDPEKVSAGPLGCLVIVNLSPQYVFDLHIAQCSAYE